MSFRFFLMSMINQHTGSRIRKHRESKGWFQRDLAKVAGLPVRTIGRIERGEVDVRISTLNKIAKALGVNVVHLLQE